MTESIFPFMDPQEVEIDEEEVPVAQEYAWDFERSDFKTRNGRMYLVERDDAIKIWLWKLFNTARFRYLIYNWDFGHELEELIGLGYTEGYLTSEAERHVREAVEYNLEDYVIGLSNINVDFSEGNLRISFVAETIYGGEVEMIV